MDIKHVTRARGTESRDADQDALVAESEARPHPTFWNIL
jgi:hypothetical protein